MGLNSYVAREPRALPIFILADTSGSMRGEKINELNLALREMLTALNDVDDIRGKFQLCVIGFGGVVAVSSDGLNLLSPTEEMAFSNETSCLCSRIGPRDFWTSDFNLDTHKPYAAFCCTDGVANGLVTGQELNLIRDIEENTSADMLKQEIQALLEDISDYCFDDKTVGVVKYE